LPRIFFYVIYPHTTVTDDEGHEFVELDAAIAEAETVLRERSAHAILEAGRSLPQAVSLRDEQGIVFHTVTLAEILGRE
jgi:hypothetical protein